MRFFLLFLSVLLLGATGCETTIVTVDGGPIMDAGPASGMLTLLSEPSAALVTGETAPIAVRYTEGGDLVAGAEVRFALIGTAHDSLLAEVSVQTGVDGRAETVVTAGTIAAAFRVRATSGGAEPVFVNVAVSTEGFGTLRVTTEYEGLRADSATQVFRVYSNTECDPVDGYPTFADRSLMVEAAEDAEARWSLPVGLSYAVVGELRIDGVVVAAGCIDNVTLTADAETEATVSLVDVALTPDGRYDALLELRPGTAGTRVIEGALLGGRDAVGDSGAGWYLDALEEELRERGKTEAADAVIAARATQQADLTAALGDVAVGPLEAINRLGAQLESRLAVVSLGGPISLSTDARVLGGVWALETLSVGSSGPDFPPPIDVGLSDLAAPMPRLELTWRPEADVIDLDSLTLTLRLGALLAAVLDAEISAADTPGMLLEDGAGCAELSLWIASEPSVATECDAGCAAAVCVRALDPLTYAIRDRLRGGEAIRDRIVLTGTLAATDEDADIVVDRVEGRGLTGVWSGASDEDPVTADLVAARLPE